MRNQTQGDIHLIGGFIGSGRKGTHQLPLTVLTRADITHRLLPTVLTRVENVLLFRFTGLVF